MIQACRDADHPHQGRRGNDSAGSVRDGYRLFGVVRAEDARPCRGLQDRGTLRLGAADRPPSQVPTERYRGPQAGLANLSHQSSQRSLGDNSSTRTARAATFGDSRRQLLGLKMRVRRSVFAAWGTPQNNGRLPERTFLERLAEMSELITLVATHAFTLMRSGSAGGKGSVEATKNDTSKNLQYIRQFWRRDSDQSIDAPEECRRDLVAPRPRCRIKPTDLVGMASSQTSIRRSLIAVITHQRPHLVFAPRGSFRGSRFNRPIHSGV